MKQANDDPRRVLNTKGKLLVPLGSLNPGQACAMRHTDGKYWHPYIIVAHHHMIDQFGRKLLPLPGRSVVKFEGRAWDVPTVSLVYQVDGTTEDVRMPTLYGPNGEKL